MSKSKQTTNKIVVQAACTRPRVFRRVPQATCRSDPCTLARVRPGSRRTDPGLRRRDRWVTTGLANQRVWHKKLKRTFRIHDKPVTKFKPLWDQLVTVLHEETTAPIQLEIRTKFKSLRDQLVTVIHVEDTTRIQLENRAKFKPLWEQLVTVVQEEDTTQIQLENCVKFKPFWDQLVTIVHDENTTHMQLEGFSRLFHQNMET